MNISLVIPTLNERESLETLLQKMNDVARNVRTNGHTLDVIFVDDGSTDGTPERIKAAKQIAAFDITLIERTERGLATAVLRGFKEARGDIVGVIDADLSHPPECIPLLVERLDEADLAVGSRHINGGGVEEWPWYRRLFSDGASALAQPLAKGVSDPMSGFFFLKKNVIEGVALTPHGYKILLEILVKGRYSAIAEVPYLFKNRDFGKSKLDWKVTLAYFYHLLKLYWWKLTRHKIG